MEKSFHFKPQEIIADYKRKLELEKLSRINYMSRNNG